MDTICYEMRGIMQRVAKAPMPALLALMLAAHGDWCFCGDTCCGRGDATATVAGDAPASGCGCCHNAQDESRGGRPASNEDDSCCGCCVESPLSQPPSDGAVGSHSPTPFYSCVAGNGVTLARAVPVAARPTVRAQARRGPPLYLRFEVLRI